MSGVKRSRRVSIEVDGLADIGELEVAAREFAESVPGQLIGEAIEAMMSTLVDVVCGVFGFPIPAACQTLAPWVCPRCPNRKGFFRRGWRSGQRVLETAAGRVTFDCQLVECGRCGCRFAPVCEMLGLERRQRRTDGLVDLAAQLATEMSYRRASDLLRRLTGCRVSGRKIRDGVVAIAPERLGPAGPTDVPIVLLDGTGERAGKAKRGVEVHLAIGIMSRRRRGKRSIAKTVLLGATLGEGWDVMATVLRDVKPGLVVIDGEEAIETMVSDLWPHVPIQRCLFHLLRNSGQVAAYVDRADKVLRDDWHETLRGILTDAYKDKDLDVAQAAYDDLIEDMEACDAPAAATHLRNARPHTFTFITDPAAGMLLEGDKGRPELGTGVIERVMRELNRRTDIGVRWSVKGLRALLMVKLAHRWDHSAVSSPAAASGRVRFALIS